MVELYESKTAKTSRVATRQAHVLGALMGYSQLAIFAVDGFIVWFGGQVRM
jgi:hypothetical protein